MLFFNKKVDICAVCQRSGVASRLEYMDPQKGFSGLLKSSNIKTLCRECFIQEFKRAFLLQESKVLVTRPCLNAPGDTYFFSTVSDLENIGLEKEDVAIVNKILKSIPNTKDCAYVDVCHLRTPEESFVPPKRFEDVQVEYLSRDEAWGRVADGFARYEGDFEEGFSSVYRDEAGMFMNMRI